MYSSTFTGIGKCVFELVKALEEDDSGNDYVLFFNSPYYETFTSENPHIKKVLVNAKHYSLREQTVFLYTLYKEKLDLMHFTHFNAPILYFKPSIVTIHDLTLSFYPGKRKTSFLHRLAYKITIKNITKRAKYIFAVSEHTKKDLIAVFNTPEEKIQVVYNGIDTDEFYPPKNETEGEGVKKKFSLNRPYFLYTGVQREHKNLARLVQAFAVFCKQYPDLDYDLVFAGKEDPSISEVRDTVIKEQLWDRVKFLGFVDTQDLRLLYGAARAYVFPSLYEWFGLTILEAMACGIPVACSHFSSLPEIAGESGAVFFNPLRIESMVNALHVIAGDDDVRKRCIVNGMERLVFFSWKKNGSEILAVYRALSKKL